MTTKTILRRPPRLFVLRRVAVCALGVGLGLALRSAGAARVAAPAELQTARLAAVGRLWGEIRFRDPHLMRDGRDWDPAVTAALPKIWGAASAQQYAAAVAELLAGTGDPAARVTESAALPGSERRVSAVRWAGAGTLLVRVGGEPAGRKDALAAQVVEQIERARAVVFDLRGANPFLSSALFDALGPHLVTAPMQRPGLRYPAHLGFSRARGEDDVYRTELHTWLLRPVLPAGKRAPRSIFLLDDEQALPALPWALAASAEAAILSSGHRPPRLEGSANGVPLGEGWLAEFSVGEAIWRGAASELEWQQSGADLDDALRWAAALTQPTGSRERGLVGARALPDQDRAVVADASYPEPALPGEAYRVLAAYRLWNTIRLFYPRPDLLDHWDERLERFLPELRASGTALDYQSALARMAAAVSDGHTSVDAAELRARFAAVAPLRSRMIEGAPAVMAVGEPLRGAVAVGDRIVSIGGVPWGQVFDRLRPFVPAATRAAQDQQLCQLALAGPEGTTLGLGVQGPVGPAREVTVSLRSNHWLWVVQSTRRSGPPYLELGAGVGYIDLGMLQEGQVGAALDGLREMRGLVLDLRAYPHETAWALAPRLARSDAPRTAVRIARPLVTGVEDPAGSGAYSGFDDRISPEPSGRFRGDVMVLIDDRTISQGEHTGLFLEAASAPMFVGSPSAGTNGDLTTLALPGDVWVSFTGQEVRHADGRPLQGIGLRPDIEVSPTLADVRAERDRVLETAIEALEQRWRGDAPTRVPSTAELAHRAGSQP